MKDSLNGASFISAMRGRDFTYTNLDWCISYLQGKGVALYWQPTPSQRTNPRGHAVTSEKDYRWMPRAEVNRPGGQGRINHADNPKFNGALERQERLAQERRFDPQAAAVSEDAQWAEKYWQREIEKLIATGVTHSERDRIRSVYQQASGSARQRYAAVEAEARRIRKDRELVR